MRSSDIRAREAQRVLPPPAPAKLRTRAERIRDEVRGEFKRFGMVDATDAVTRPAEEWEGCR